MLPPHNVQETLVVRIKEGMTHDPQAKTILTYNDGRTRRFWMEDELLYAKGSCIYVPYGPASKGVVHACPLGKTTVGHIYGRTWSFLFVYQQEQRRSARTKGSSPTIAHSLSVLAKHLDGLHHWASSIRWVREYYCHCGQISKVRNFDFGDKKLHCQASCQVIPQTQSNIGACQATSK